MIKILVTSAILVTGLNTPAFACDREGGFGMHRYNPFQSSTFNPASADDSMDGNAGMQQVASINPPQTSKFETPSDPEAAPSIDAASKVAARQDSRPAQAKVETIGSTNMAPPKTPANNSAASDNEEVARMADMGSSY